MSRRRGIYVLGLDHGSRIKAETVSRTVQRRNVVDLPSKNRRDMRMCDLHKRTVPGTVEGKLDGKKSSSNLGFVHRRRLLTCFRQGVRCVLRYRMSQVWIPFARHLFSCPVW